MSSALLGLNLSQTGHSAPFSSNDVFCFNWFIRGINLAAIIRVLVTLEETPAPVCQKNKNAEVLNQFTLGHLKLCPVKASLNSLLVFSWKVLLHLVGDANSEMSSFLVKKKGVSSFLL